MIVENIPLSLIDEDIDQPRYTFDDEGLNELANSIIEIGLLNPIKVRKLENGRFKIIFGNRRYKAFKQLDKEEIPCIISEMVDEVEIYLEQLAENIQRENFTPIEEAEAFNKLMNGTFRVSSKFLSNKLGKSENYIRTKIDLLIFGEQVRELIKSGKETAPNKLTDEQLLPLKDISFEFRDSLALVIAKDQIPPKDVKRIATLFKDSEIKQETKKNLITKTSDELLRTWSIYDEEKKAPTKTIEKPTIVNDNFNTSEEMQTFQITLIESKLQDLISRIPAHRPIANNAIFSFEQINIENKEDFLRGIDSLINNMEKHLVEWRKIRDLAKKSSLKVIK